MDQEVWITLRLKGYADAGADAGAIAEALLTDLQQHVELGVGTHGFMTSQPGDVLKVEEEAAIYGNADEERSPEHAAMLGALRRAESFISGFEGDELQEGIDEMLAGIRGAIAEAEGK